MALNNAAIISLGKFSFMQGDAGSFSSDNSSFDGIYSFEVLEHILDSVNAIQEMVRGLKPGGFLLLSVRYRFSLGLHIKRIYCQNG